MESLKRNPLFLETLLCQDRESLERILQELEVQIQKENFLWEWAQYSKSETDEATQWALKHHEDYDFLRCQVFIMHTKALMCPFSQICQKPSKMKAFVEFPKPRVLSQIQIFRDLIEDLLDLVTSLDPVNISQQIFQFQNQFQLLSSLLILVEIILSIATLRHREYSDSLGKAIWDARKLLQKTLFCISCTKETTLAFHRDVYVIQELEALFNSEEIGGDFVPKMNALSFQLLSSHPNNFKALKHLMSFNPPLQTKFSENICSEGKDKPAEEENQLNIISYSLLEEEGNLERE